MANSTTLIQSSPEQLAELIDAKVKERLEALKNVLQKKDANDELLTRDEACEFLQINPSTLWHWQKRGKRSEEHTSELQSRGHLVCRLLLEKKKSNTDNQEYDI